MKKVQKTTCAVLTAAIAVGGAMALTACNKPLTDEPLSTSVVADYTKTEADRAETFASGSKGYSWENGDPFNVWWKPENVTYENNKMQLAISEMAVKEQKWDEETGDFVDVVSDYYGAEARTEHYYGFGDFQVRMKPAKITGTASTFFTCTGPYDVWYEGDPEKERKNDHDEIDIEFLGKDTTKVQFNYFAGGVGGHEYMYDLGFDASEAFHDYGFRWAEDHITWFVDNVPVYRVDRKDGEDWPEDPGRMIMNYWCATESASAWMGEFADDYTGKAEYEWIATSAAQQVDPATTKSEPVTPPQGEIDVPETGWTDIPVNGFDGWGMYTVDTTSGVTISHDEEKSGYKCCGMSLADSYSWIKFNIKNNDTVNAADLRIDVKKENGNGGVEAVSPANDKVKVSAADSAALIELAAGENIDVAFKIKNIYVDQFVVFLNSMSADSATQGSITISELKGIINGDVQPPVVEPEQPETPNEGCSLLTFTTTEAYTVDKTGKAAASITATYGDVIGATYKNIAANAAELAAEKDTFSVKVTNNSIRAVKVRIDLIGEQKATVGANPNMECCNLDATASKDVGIYTDTTWGGTTFTLAAGDTVVITITYSNTGAMGAVQKVQFYMDSFSEDDRDKDVHYTDGSLTFADFKFAKAGDPITPPQGGGDPVNPPDGGDVAPFDIPANGWEEVEYRANEYTLNGWDHYTIEEIMPYGYFDGHRIISKENDNGIPNGYNCAWTLYKKFEFVKFALKNELGEAAVVRFDFCYRDDNDNIDPYSGAVKGVCVNGKYIAVDADSKAALITLKPYELADVVVKLDTTRTDTNIIVIYLNSLGDEGTNPRQGKIIVSDMKGIANTAVNDAKVYEPIPETGWTDISFDTFNNWNDAYTTFDKTNGVTLGHTTSRAVNACVGMEFDKNYTWLKFTVKNNSLNKVAKLRFDVKKEGTVPGLVDAVFPTSLMYLMSVDNKANSGKAASITIPAGETVEVVLKLKAEYFDRLVVFLNSCKEGDNPDFGNVTISDLKGIVDESIKHTDVDPNSEYAAKLNFDRRESDKYNVSNNDGTTNVRYDNLDKKDRKSVV